MRYQRIKHILEPPYAEIQLIPAGGPITIDELLAAEIIDICDELLFQDDIRVVSITGQGQAFATGRISPPADIVGADSSQQLDWINGLKAAGAVAGLPMPVVAVLNGDATAHGLELALAADLRIAADSVVVAAGKIGQVGFPFDGATQRLPRLVGPALARDMLLTGRTLTASECLDAGLVNRVVAANELSAAARALASQIVDAAPIASRFAKEAVTAAGDMTLEQGLRLEADLSIILQSTSDREEGLLAFREKRVARFLGQ